MSLHTAIYKMLINETIEFETTESGLKTKTIAVTRVPGGWVYTHYGVQGDNGPQMSSCFVPYQEQK